MALTGVPSAFVVSQALDPVIWAAFNNTFDIMRNSGADLNLEANFPALQAFLENQAAVSKDHYDFVYIVLFAPLRSHFFFLFWLSLRAIADLFFSTAPRSIP